MSWTSETSDRGRGLVGVVGLGFRFFGLGYEPQIAVPPAAGAWFAPREEREVSVPMALLRSFFVWYVMST